MGTQALMNRVGRLPVLHEIRRLLYDYRVRTGAPWRFWGVFRSRDEAIRRAESLAHLPVGYDTAGLAAQGRELYEQVHTFDYPPLLWLLRSLEDGSRSVVDLGGHLGVKYRAYRRLWDLPADLRWTVCETPDVVQAARDLPPDDLPPGLTFTSDRSCLAEAEVLFASGVLQYLEQPLPEILARLPRKPRHLVLNKVPLSEGPEVWTIQNVGAVVPYHVMNRHWFLDEMSRSATGSSTRGRWPSTGRGFPSPPTTGRSTTPASR